MKLDAFQTTTMRPAAGQMRRRRALKTDGQACAIFESIRLRWFQIPRFFCVYGMKSTARVRSASCVTAVCGWMGKHQFEFHSLSISARCGMDCRKFGDVERKGSVLDIDVGAKDGNWVDDKRKLRQQVFG